ncbi:hypothetical protein [Nitratireductor rhodophyticola]|uniref:hypothetical protein n=1 Tax=Nitratireductor rhodophyticola TaxID=2854036 RepID=UPI0030089907
MPKKSPHPHVAWREGRPRFQPAQDLREKGLKGTDLRWPDPAPSGWRPQDLQPGEKNEGAWFTRGEAVDWSAAFREGLAEAQKGEQKRPKGRPPKKGGTRFYTVARLFDDWQRSPKFVNDPPIGYSPNTRRDYRQKLTVIETDHQLVWNAPVAALEQPTIRSMFEEIWEARGLATANGVVRVLSSAISWAMLRGKVRMPVNPALKIKMEVPAPRVRFATRREIDALVATADAIGRPELGDMVILAVWTGQRQADRRALVDKGLLNNRRVFRQAKTGAVVAIHQVRELEKRLTLAETRRKAVRAQALLAARSDEERARAELTFSHVILDERRWVPIKKYHYTHLFADLREQAVAGVRDEGGRQIVEPCPSLADFWDLDLRDTAVTWMALAGATIPEICAVTGHTLESATRILKHYLARHPEMADSAMRKMVEWYDGGGETEIGL